MTEITIETDRNGWQMVLLSDEPKYGLSKKCLPVQNILINVSTGHLFHAPPGLTGLSRLGPAEAAMIEHYLREAGGVHEPVVFAGDTPPDG